MGPTVPYSLSPVNNKVLRYAIGEGIYLGARALEAR